MMIPPIMINPILKLAMIQNATMFFASLINGFSHGS